MQRRYVKFVCFFIILLGAFLFYSAGEDFEDIFRIYDQELNNAIQQSRSQSTFDAFVTDCEMRLNILTSQWEMDRMLMKINTVQNEDSNITPQQIDDAYNSFLSTVSDKVIKAKAEYISKDIDTSELAQQANEDKAALIISFQALYDEISETITKTDPLKLDRGALALTYRQLGWGEIENLLANASISINDFFDTRQREKETLALSYGISDLILNNSFEEEKRRFFIDRQQLLSGIYNTYLYRISRMILSDQDSLKFSEEKERAKSIAEDIQKHVKETLETSINEKLDTLLSSKVLTEDEVANLGGELSSLYKQGLDIWAKAATELVQQQQKWYLNYNDIYNGGIEAWTNAIKQLVQN
ncbi:MAG: hypothetical protein GX435_07805, partial [Exilispira sp.]|nr:hypothetical protein [Exilispira sp.]